jgi:hypothetical protein
MSRAITEFALHHFAKIPEAEHHARDSLRAKQLKLMGEKRLAGDRHEDFGNLFRNGPQTCRKTTREDGNGVGFESNSHAESRQKLQVPNLKLQRNTQHQYPRFRLSTRW